MKAVERCIADDGSDHDDRMLSCCWDLLPPSTSAEIIRQWLDIRSVVSLDTALCNHFSRAELWRSYRSAEVVSHSMFLVSESDDKMATWNLNMECHRQVYSKLLKWAKQRELGVRLSNVSLNDLLETKETVTVLNMIVPTSLKSLGGERRIKGTVIIPSHIDSDFDRQQLCLKIQQIDICNHPISEVLATLFALPLLERVTIVLRDDDSFSSPMCKEFRWSHLRELSVSSATSSASTREFVRLIVTRAPQLQVIKMPYPADQDLSLLKTVAPQLKLLQLMENEFSGGKIDVMLSETVMTPQIDDIRPQDDIRPRLSLLEDHKIQPRLLRRIFDPSDMVQAKSLCIYTSRPACIPLQIGHLNSLVALYVHTCATFREDVLSCLFFSHLKDNTLHNLQILRWQCKDMQAAKLTPIRITPRSCLLDVWRSSSSMHYASTAVVRLHALLHHPLLLLPYDLQRDNRTSIFSHLSKIEKHSSIDPHTGLRHLAWELDYLPLHFHSCLLYAEYLPRRFPNVVSLSLQGASLRCTNARALKGLLQHMPQLRRLCLDILIESNAVEGGFQQEAEQEEEADYVASLALHLFGSHANAHTHTLRNPVKSSLRSCELNVMYQHQQTFKDECLMPNLPVFHCSGHNEKQIEYYGAWGNCLCADVYRLMYPLKPYFQVLLSSLESGRPSEVIVLPSLASCVKDLTRLRRCLWTTAKVRELLLLLVSEANALLTSPHVSIR